MWGRTSSPTSARVGPWMTAVGGMLGGTPTPWSGRTTVPWEHEVCTVTEPLKSVTPESSTEKSSV